MDLNGIQGILQWLAGASISSAGIFLVIRFLGKKIFSSLVIEVIDEEYNKNLKEKIENLIDEQIQGKTKELKEEMLDHFSTVLDNHATKCKSVNTEVNDNRYLLRQEFKMFLENQFSQNRKVETTLSELRNVCDQILLKLSNR